MQEPHFIKCHSGWQTATGETAAYVPDLLIPPANNLLAAVKIEPCDEFASEDVQEADMSIVKEEYEMKELSVYPATDKQLIVKDDPQEPFTYPFEEEIDLDTVKEELNVNSADNDEKNDDHYQVPMEDSLIDIVKVPPADIKSEDEHTVDQIVACFQEGKNVENVAVSTGVLVESRLMQQTQSRTEVRPFFCSICNNRFTDGSLETHLLDVHSAVKPFKCSICESTFMWLSDFKDHEFIHIGGKPPSIWDKDFRKLVGLPTDQQINNGDWPFKCSICGASFKKLPQLRMHEILHIGCRPIACAICGKSFKRLYNLRLHEKMHSGGKVDFSCSICGTEFKRLSKLKQHENLHRNRRPFVCSTCGVAFKTPNQLSKHQKVHIDKKPLICSICSKAFKSSLRLQKHERHHIADLPVSCSICGNRFATSSGLGCHMRIHNDKQTFSCSICGRAFKRSLNLWKHEKIHNDSKAHKAPDHHNVKHQNHHGVKQT